MKEKVEEEEALAQAYGDIGQAKSTLDDEINQAIGKDNKVNTELDEIKKKLGIQ